MNRHAAFYFPHHRENVAVVVDDGDDARAQDENAYECEFIGVKHASGIYRTLLTQSDGIGGHVVPVGNADVRIPIERRLLFSPQ